MVLNLICPNCRKLLSSEEAKYVCRYCNKIFPIIDEIPIFIDDLKEFENEEKQYRKNTSSFIQFDKDSRNKVKLLNFYIRSRPAEILLQRGFKGRKGIDIGVGTGKNENFEHIYKKVSKDVIGVDVSLSAAKGFIKNFPNATCILASKLPFEDESFNFITASGLVHHLIGQSHYNFVSSFSEWYRVLKPGGIFISNDPNLFYPISLMMHIPNRILQKFRPGARGRVSYERPVSFFEVRSVLKKVGFKNINFEASTFAHWSTPLKIIRVLMTKELNINAGKSLFIKYFGAWICIYAEK